MTTELDSNKSLELLSLAIIITITGGLLLPKAAFHGLDRGLLVWFVVCLSSGIVLGSIHENLLWLRIRRAMLACATLWITVVIFYIIRWLVSRIININAQSIVIPFGSGASIDLFDPRLFWLLGILLVIFWIGSVIVVGITSFSSNLLITGAKKAYEFGPTGFDRLRNIIAGVASTVAAVIALWSAFG